MIRELMTRFGRDNLGFLWVFIEPMLLCVGVMSLWSLIKSPFEHGLQLVGLVLTGYMPLTLWRHLTSSAGVRPFSRSAGLLYHRHVTLLDTFFTRIFLEFAGTTTAFVMVSAVLIATGLVDPPQDIGLVAGGWMLMASLSIGAALTIAIITEYFEIAEKFVPVFQYLMLPLSGCFFMVDWLPSYAQDAIWYNPQVHCFELIRAGFFGSSVTTFYSAWYPAVSGVALFALGIGFVERARDHLHA
jgi:capsular polysaccharide transport system permease protein